VPERERFEGQKVKADTAISSMVVHRTLDVPEGAFLIANNLITAFSLITQTLSWKVGQEFAVPVWNANILQPLFITMKATGKERLNDKEVLTVDVAPIGERFYISPEDGRLLKLVDERQKLEVLREE